MRRSQKAATKPSAAPASELSQTRARRHFSAEFKAEAVRLLRRRRADGVSWTQIARELDIAPGLLWEWERKLAGGRERAEGTPTGLPGESVEEENRRLRRENAILREEREFAKKAAAFFAKESL